MQREVGSRERKKERRKKKQAFVETVYFKMTVIHPGCWVNKFFVNL